MIKVIFYPTLNMLKKHFVLTFFFLSFISQVHASTWALLPVRLNGIDAKDLTIGGSTNASRVNKTFDLSKTIALYLKAGKIFNIIPVSMVEKVYKNLHLHAEAGLNTTKLKSIAEMLDADKLLITTISRVDGYYSIVGSVYHRYSQIVTDTLQVKNKNLWKATGEYLKKRFFSTFNANFQSSDNKKFISRIFGIDARGKSHYDFKYFKQVIKLYKPENGHVIHVNGYGDMVTSRKVNEFKNFHESFNNVRCKGNDSKDTLYSRLLAQINKTVQYNPSKNKEVILLVSGAPRNSHSVKRVKSFMRNISRYAKVFIFGSPLLNNTERNFWVSLAEERSNKKVIIYKNIVYKMKVGLSQGYELFLFQNGHALLQSSDPRMSKAQNLNISNQYSNKLSPENMVSLFEKKTGYKVISRTKAEPLFKLNFDIIFKKGSTTLGNNEIRVLLDMHGRAFWISLPRSLMYDKFGKLQIKEGNFYSFLLNLKPGYQGIPMQNDSQFGYIIKSKEKSSHLQLDIKSYLLNPGRYLNKSIGGSSIYIVRGKVRKIRYKTRNLY